MFNFWWLAEQSEQQKFTKMWQKRPPKSLKNEMLIFGLCSTSDDWLSDLSEESWLEMWKDPLKCCFKKWNAHVFDYVQLLMIQDEWSVCPPPRWKGQQIGSLRNLGFSDLHLTSLNPCSILLELFSSTFDAMQLDLWWLSVQKWFTLQMYNLKAPKLWQKMKST